jgi:hypothetical protein
VADGKLGYAERGPYDAIHVGAAAAGLETPPITIFTSSPDQSVCPNYQYIISLSLSLSLSDMCSIDEAELPDALVNQLKPNGRMVIPVGTSSQVWFFSLSQVLFIYYGHTSYPVLLMIILTIM